MEIQRHNGTLSVRDVRELSAANARSFRNEVCARLEPGVKHVEIDLSRATAVDVCGIGALVSLHKAATGRHCNPSLIMRLLNPQPTVRQILELTRMHHLFEISPAQRRESEQAPSGRIDWRSAPAGFWRAAEQPEFVCSDREMVAGL